MSAKFLVQKKKKLLVDKSDVSHINFFSVQTDKIKVDPGIEEVTWEYKEKISNQYLSHNYRSTFF